MKIFRRQSSSSHFSSLDESSTTREERSDDAHQLRPYSVDTQTLFLRDHHGIDTSSIFRSRWTASRPCLGDMTQTDVAAESLLSSNEESHPLPDQTLMEDEKLIVSLVEQEKLRHEADGLVIGETPAGWIRAPQVRQRMGHSVRTVQRAIKSTIGAAARRNHEVYNMHSTPISSDEENYIEGVHIYDDDDGDDDDSIISFNTENFIKPLALEYDDDGDARRRGNESRRARRRRRLRIVRDNLKKTVLQARVSIKASRNEKEERRAVSPDAASSRNTTLSADMVMDDPLCGNF
jgi:hypothetical protein